VPLHQPNERHNDNHLSSWRFFGRHYPHRKEPLLFFVSYPCRPAHIRAYLPAAKSGYCDCIAEPFLPLFAYLYFYQVLMELLTKKVAVNENYYSSGRLLDFAWGFG